MTDTQTDQTTHSDQTNNIDLEQQKRGRRMFLLMFAIFFGPFFVAALAKYYGWFAVTDTVNYGKLINPPVQMSDVQLGVSNKDNKQVQLREKWSLLLFIPSVCDDPCLKSVREVEAIHLLLNRDIQRVQLLAVDNLNLDAGLYRYDLVDDANLKAVLNEFSQAGQPQVGTYLIDPKGFLVLQYPQELEGAKLQKDLKRLLKYSRIG